MKKNPTRRRKVYTQTEKLNILAEADASGDNRAVADKHGFLIDYLYKWRRELKAKGAYPPKGDGIVLSSSSHPGRRADDKTSMSRTALHKNMPPAAASGDEVEKLIRTVGYQAIEIMELREQLKRRG